MKKEFLYAFAIAALLLLVVAAAGAFAIDEVRDGIQYDVKAEKVFVGAVHDTPSEYQGWMYFTLWTSNGIVAVQMGPKEFVERRGFRIQAGQMVSVIGMHVVVGNRDMVLAREITKTGSVFVVRDRNGRPMWKTERPIEMDPEVGDTEFPVC
jgi:hypothetical protein